MRCCWPPAAGCSRTGGARASSPASESEKVLNVYNWSDYIQPTVIADFEKEYGIHVNYDVFDSNEILETKLLTGHTNYDVVVPSGAFLERQIQADVYRSSTRRCCRTSRTSIRRWPAPLSVYDPGNQYGVDYMWITSGVGYNAAASQGSACRMRRSTAGACSSIRRWCRNSPDCGVSILDAPVEVVAHGAAVSSAGIPTATRSRI